jgi:hypothetical protein
MANSIAHTLSSGGPSARCNPTPVECRTIHRLDCVAVAPARVPARIVWTRVCNSGGLFHGGCLTGFMG